MAKKKTETEAINPESIEVIVDPDEGQSAESDEEVNSAADQKSGLEDVLRAEIEHLNKELTEAVESHLRAAAEIQNVRKRHQVELDKARKYAIDNFAKSLLEVMESLDQACEIDDDSDIGAMREGVELTRKQLLSVFEKASIRKIVPNRGDSFDVNEQQAMTLVPTEEFPPNHVVEVFRPGYMIHDRLLRPAMVIVSTELPEPDEAQKTESTDSEASENA